MDKFPTLPALSLGDRRLLLEVAILLGVTRVGLMLLPFGVVRHALERFLAAPGWRYPRPGDTQEQLRIAWAADVAGRSILGDKPCLAKALVVHALLRRRGLPARLVIGVRKDAAGQLCAHAWVQTEERIIVGGPTALIERFAPLSAPPGSGE